MDTTRRLIVDLQNLVSRAREAVALDRVESTKEALDAANSAALAAMLDDAKTKARRRAKVHQHPC